MLPGYNHNVRYQGVIFHIQTEDSGVAKSQITTLLYRDGTIIASKKTDYSDIVRVDMLDKVVEDLMKEQHKDMLRRLKAGEFDERAFAPGEAGAAKDRPAPPSADRPADTGQSQAPKPFTNPKPGQTLDEIIFEYLASDRD